MVTGEGNKSAKFRALNCSGPHPPPHPSNPPFGPPFPFREASVSALVPLLAVSTLVSCLRLASPGPDQSLRDKLCTAASALTVSHVDPDHVVHGRSSLQSHACLWVLLPGLMLYCVFCDAPQSDLSHCLSSCLAFSDFRVGSLLLLLNGLAILGCSTQALLTTLFPLLSLFRRASV